MDVTFIRTGTRRYRVTVERGKAPGLVMEPAPGFDEYLPHDLVHLLVEQHWGLGEGIYGDLDAGGDAGTFRLTEGTRDRRAAEAGRPCDVRARHGSLGGARRRCLRRLASASRRGPPELRVRA